MRSLSIAVVDLVTHSPTRSLWPRFMNANLASIMGQSAAVWCEELGHRVRFVCYTGGPDIFAEIGDEVDVLIVGAFTRSALTAYALAHHYRKRGALTVLGGPHARCYPEDAVRYFDVVLGFTDKALIEDVLSEPAPRGGIGEYRSAAGQPHELPSARQRWKYIRETLRGAPSFLKMVPMISSLGCPYTCPFCIDSTVRFQPLGTGQLAEDLRFVEKAMPDAIIAWHDPNFGVRFDEYLSVIEQASAARKLRFLAESSLSLLSEPNVKRMARAGFVALLPGIESWYGMGFKSKTGASQGRAKVDQVADHVNMLVRHMPYVQVNFVLGLDDDEGEEPFDLTKLFVDKVPGAFPAYSQRTAFGAATPENLALQKAGRVLGFPFHFLDNNQVMNVVPRHYRWDEFYRNLLGLSEHSFSARAVWRRWWGTRQFPGRAVNFIRAVSSEGRGRIRHYRNVLRALETDPAMRRYLGGESDVLPAFYREKMRRDLGPIWHALPPGAVQHDAYALLSKSDAVAAAPRPSEPSTNRIQIVAAAAKT